MCCVCSVRSSSAVRLCVRSVSQQRRQNNLIMLICDVDFDLAETYARGLTAAVNWTKRGKRRGKEKTNCINVSQLSICVLHSIRSSFAVFFGGKDWTGKACMSVARTINMYVLCEKNYIKPFPVHRWLHVRSCVFAHCCCDALTNPPRNLQWDEAVEQEQQPPTSSSWANSDIIIW